jgi:hypothetical protein
MARWQYGENYKKRASKNLTFNDRRRAERFLENLSRHPPPSNLRLRPMEGHNGILWECQAGGQNRFILRRTKDEVGDLFIVEDVGPHDIYKRHRP